MTTFTLDTDNNITVYASDQEARAAHAGKDGVHFFLGKAGLASLANNWPITRLVEIWNSFAGVVPFDELKPVKKFTDRKAAVGRIWKAIQRLDAAPEQQAAPVAPKKAKATKRATAKGATPKAAKKPKKATAKGAAPKAREGSKKAQVLELLRRPDGATLADIMAATGWQKHSVRGFISGALGKKMGLTVESIKTTDGARSYRIAK